MKTKITTKEAIHKLTRSKRKREIIHTLTRRASGRLHSNRKRTKKLAQQHLAIAILLAFVTGGSTSLAFAISTNLIPPPAVGGYPETEEVLKRYITEYQPQQKPNPPDQVGIASWYALGLRQPDALTCASTRFPRGTYLRVKNVRNGREVTCLVNDYGPQPWTKKVIDLSRGSFVQIGSLGSGVAAVEIRVVH